jgi:hypothetical protein
MKKALALLLITSPALAQDGPPTFHESTAMGGTVASISACTEAFADLPRIAERLEVNPVDQAKSYSATMVLTMCDGRSYDFVALLNAFLDKLDKAH